MWSCTAEEHGTVLAEAYGAKLYDTELSRLVPDDATVEDSVFLVKEYINVWIAKQILLNQAETELTSEEKDKSAELEQYRMDLLTYEVLNKLALQSADTTFDEGELQAYYDSTTDDIDLLWSSFKSGDESVFGTLRELAADSGNYFDDKDSWVFFDDILKEIPINTYNQEHFLNNNKRIRLVDGGFEYFIRIIDFKIRSATSPYEMEKANIKEILYVKRQQELVKTIETKLLQDAYSNKEIKIF
jgi:hypothetical protein